MEVSEHVSYQMQALTVIHTIVAIRSVSFIACLFQDFNCDRSTLTMVGKYLSNAQPKRS